ncbi:MAG: hypothetical protein ACM32F_12125, partial [Betaproteobacteria bacterium]
RIERLFRGPTPALKQLARQCRVCHRSRIDLVTFARQRQRRCRFRRHAGRARNALDPARRGIGWRGALAIAITTTTAAAPSTSARATLSRCFVAPLALGTLLRWHDVAVHVTGHGVLTFVVMVNRAGARAARLRIGGQ